MSKATATQATSSPKPRKRAAKRKYVPLPADAPEVLNADRPMHERSFKMGDRYVSWEFLMST